MLSSKGQSVITPPMLMINQSSHCSHCCPNLNPSNVHGSLKQSPASK